MYPPGESERAGRDSDHFDGEGYAQFMETTVKRGATAPARAELDSGTADRRQSWFPGWLLALERAVTSVTTSEWAFGALLTFCVIYFIMPLGSNDQSRWDMVYALIHGTAIIDQHAHNTIDISLYHGHYYSPRTIGLSIVATPVLWLLGHVVSLDQPATISYTRQVYILDLFTVFPAAIAVALFFRRFIARLRPELAKSPLPYVAAGAFALATLEYPYSEFFISHVYGGALLFIAFYLLYRARSVENTAPWLIVAGLLAGLGVITEYLAALIAAILCGYILLAFTASWATRIKSLALFVAGTLPSVAILGWYNWFAFGNPFYMSYGFVVGQQFQKGQHTGFFGLTLPTPGNIWEILVYPRGLLMESPWLILLPLGFYFWYRSGRARLEALVAILSSVIYILAVASYFLPMGGDYVVGPRLLVPVLPFLCLGLAWMIDDSRLWLRGLFTATLGFSLLITFFYVVGGVRLVPGWSAYPVKELFIPLLLHGRVPIIDGYTPDNLGARLLHLPQMVSTNLLGLVLLLWFYVAAKALLRYRPPQTGRAQPGAG